MEDIKTYRALKELGAWKWMMIHHKRKMIFSFLFMITFTIGPWTDYLYIEELWLRITVSGVMLFINFLLTFYHPYSIYRRNLELLRNREENRK